MDGKSKNIKDIKLQHFKNLYPELFTENILDVEKFKALFDNDFVEFKDERYHLTWAGKSDCYKVIQQATSATLIPVKSDSIDWDQTENIFIEGENLEVLKILQRSYHGKIKMIYIDPPYNTGNDSFIYPDRYSETREDYRKRAGELDEAGNLTNEGFFRKNSKDNGRFHSNWLSMMYPRLFLARNLLKEDGIIFVSIDDNEIHNLRMIMNEIYGEENLLQEIIWKRHAGGGNDSKYFAIDHEYILCYARNKQAIENLRIPLTDLDKKEYKGKDKHFETLGPFKTKSFYRMRPDDPRPGLQYNIIAPDGEKLFGEWKWEEKEFLKAYADEKVIIRKDNNENWSVEYKIYLNDKENEERLKVPRSMILSEARNSQGKAELAGDLGKQYIFNNPKPIELIQHLINIAINKNEEEIVLDFFAGSCSTAVAVMKMNAAENAKLKYIMVQFAEKTEEESEAYKNKFKNIAEIGKTRIQNVIKKSSKKSKKLNHAKDLGYKAFCLSKSNFKQWQVYSNDSEEYLNEQIDFFTKPLNEIVDDEKIIFEIIIKAGYSLNSEIEEIKSKNEHFYKITNFNKDSSNKSDEIMIIVLKTISDKSISEIIKVAPKKVICLDSVFDKKDELKTNVSLQLKELRIEFITI